jgi:hypothetical protein
MTKMLPRTRTLTLTEISDMARTRTIPKNWRRRVEPIDHPIGDIYERSDGRMVVTIYHRLAAAIPKHRLGMTS